MERASACCCLASEAMRGVHTFSRIKDGDGALCDGEMCKHVSIERGGSLVECGSACCCIISDGMRGVCMHGRTWLRHTKGTSWILFTGFCLHNRLANVKLALARVWGCCVDREDIPWWSAAPLVVVKLKVAMRDVCDYGRSQLRHTNGMSWIPFAGCSLHNRFADVGLAPARVRGCCLHKCIISKRIMIIAGFQSIDYLCQVPPLCQGGAASGQTIDFPKQTGTAQ